MTNTPRVTCPPNRLSDESNRFLAKWRIEASIDGFLGIRPVGPNLGFGELSDMIGRLTHAYRNNPPAVMAFDFCDVDLPIWKWRHMHTILLEFARSIGGCFRVVSAGSRSAAIVLIRAFGGSTPCFKC